MSDLSFLHRGGEMGARLRAFDWRRTALGDARFWPDSIKTALRICLASRQPMSVWWGPELIHFYNDASISLLGNRHPGALGQPASLVWVQIWARIEERVAAAMAGEATYCDAEPLILDRGGYPEETYYTFSFNPLPGDEGRIDGIVCTAIDETARVLAARRLAQEVEVRRRHAQQQNLMLDELNHRVKNTLATVQAIAMQTLKGVDADARNGFLDRLFALSSQHDLLALSNWEGASLEEVIVQALAPYGEKDRLVIAGPAVRLAPKRALALGMAFHELAANAARHGALGNAQGRVEIRWTIDAAGEGLHLDWIERDGPRFEAPCEMAAKGFGLRLIEQGLAREIAGDVAFVLEPEGLRCSWDMPL